MHYPLFNPHERATGSINEAPVTPSGYNLSAVVKELFADTDREAHAIMNYYLQTGRQMRGVVLTEPERDGVAASYEAVLHAREWAEKARVNGRRMVPAFTHMVEVADPDYWPSATHDIVPDMSRLPDAPVSPVVGFAGGAALSTENAMLLAGQRVGQIV